MQFFELMLTAALSSLAYGQLDSAGGFQAAQGEGAPWSIVLVSDDEPGEALIVTGTVYVADGKTPLEGITVYVYHTDAEGYYRKGNNSPSNPRLRGWMKTDAEGKYEFRTIMPAPYPSGSIPAHIHYVLSGRGHPRQRDRLMFKGDPRLSDTGHSRSKQNDAFSAIRPLTRDRDGIWRCVKDIKLKRLQQ